MKNASWQCSERSRKVMDGMGLEIKAKLCLSRVPHATHLNRRDTAADSSETLTRTAHVPRHLFTVAMWQARQIITPRKSQEVLVARWKCASLNWNRQLTLNLHSIFSRLPRYQCIDFSFNFSHRRCWWPASIFLIFIPSTALSLSLRKLQHFRDLHTSWCTRLRLFIMIELIQIIHKFTTLSAERINSTNCTVRRLLHI